jgi:hypothetical protein
MSTAVTTLTQPFRIYQGYGVMADQVSGMLINDVELPADAGSEFRILVTYISPGLSLNLSEDGSYSMTTSAAGTYTWRYMVEQDGELLLEDDNSTPQEGVVTWAANVSGGFDPTVVQPDTASGVQGSPITGNVLSNDSDPDGPLHVSQFVINGTTYVVTSSVNGNASLSGIGTLNMASTGDFTFTPNSGFSGTVPDIIYTATDGTSSGTSTLTITVAAASLSGTASGLWIAGSWFIRP